MLHMSSMESIRLSGYKFGQMLVKQAFFHSFCVAWPMATRKDTPKKIYSRSASTETSSSCRLCKAVVDRRHSKDLFSATNRAILTNAQNIYGRALTQDQALPHLICRPCERRLDNAIKFKKVIEETQKSLESVTRSKRCIEISPSVTQPSTSRVRASNIGGSSRRSLDFTKSFPSDVSTNLLSCMNNSHPLFPFSAFLIL